jgi:hypothetical protein
MRKLLLSLFFFGVFFGITAQAQISEGSRSMSAGSQNAMVITLPGTTDKFVDKQWKDFMKKYDGKVKNGEGKNMTFTDDAKIADIGGANTVDVYAQALEKGEDVEFVMWVDLGGAYLSSQQHKERYTGAEKFLMRFALQVATEQTKEELKEEEKKMKNLENDMKRLERDNERYHKEIQDAEQRIQKAKSDIEQNLRDQEEMQRMIKEQEKMLDLVKKKLKDLK